MDRIVQILGEGALGGGTTYVTTLTAELIRRGYDTTVMTCAGSFLEVEARNLGAKVIGLPFGRRRNTPALALLLRRHFDRIRPAIVHAHGVRAGLPPALAANAKSWKFLYTVHGLHFTNKRQPGWALGWFAEKACMGRAHNVIFVAEHDREQALQSILLSGTSHHVVVPNAVQVNIGPDWPVAKRFDIAFLGRLVPQKNPLLLCDILMAMRPLCPTLLVIGGGPLWDKLKSKVEQSGLTGQVTMIGALSREEALRQLAQCRTLVMPSCHEGQPLALMEAAHLGLPVVASALPGIQEILDEGKTGYLVPPADGAAYAERLSRLLNNPDLAERIAARAQRTAAQQFCFSRVVETHLQLYQLSAAPSVAAGQPSMRLA